MCTSRYLECETRERTVHAGQQLSDYPSLHFSLSSLSLRCDSIDLIDEEDARRQALQAEIGVSCAGESV